MSRPMSMASARPQLNLDEMRRLKWLLGGALALVSLWTVFFLDIEALGLVAVCSVLIASAMVWPQLPTKVPLLIWRLAVPGIIVAVAVDFYLSKETLPVLIRLAVLLVLYRAVAYRRKREDLQLLVLGLFLIVVAGVLTVALEFAALLLVFTACALGFLFVVTLIDLVEVGPRVMQPEDMREVPGWARGSWPVFFRRLRAVADWRLLGLGAVLFAGVVAISALLFLLIPRFEIGSGFFLDKYLTRKTRTGFSEAVRFGDVGELVQDGSVAFRVDLPPGSKPPADLYWRLLILDEYTPQGFRLSAWMKGQLLRNDRAMRVLRGGGAWTSGPRESAIWTIYVEPGISRYLPLPGAYGMLRLRDAAQVQTSEPNRLVALRNEPVAMTAYQIEGLWLAPEVRDGGFARLLRGWQRGGEGVRDARNYFAPMTLALPEGPANAAVLTRVVSEIAKGENGLSAEQFATRATEWLRRRHAYTLSVHIPRGEGDDIVRWLDSNEPGFCEHFAASLTVLCRAAGYPARVVAGFHGGTVNGFENYIMVRNSDAHAWAEIFNGKDVWLRWDATPGAVTGPTENVTAAAQRERDSSWTARLDSLRVLWYRRVVSFDTRQQVELAEAVKNATTGTAELLRARLEAMSKQLKAWLVRPWDWRRAGKTAFGVMAIIVVAAGLVRGGVLLLRRWRQWRDPRGLDPVRREAGHWLKTLARNRGSSPARPSVCEELERLRYGRPETWPEPRSVFKRARLAARKVTST